LLLNQILVIAKKMNSTILVVAAHADDEALGCGGTILRHISDGDIVHAVFMTDGVGSRGQRKEDDAQRRKKAAEKAREILGLQTVKHLGFPDNKMDSIAILDVVQDIEILVKELAPKVIYTHHCGDLNVDHRVTLEATMVACRPQPDCTVKEVYGFEVLSSTEWGAPQQNPFVPNMYVDISQFLAKKCEVLGAYVSEMREAPHSRSIDHVQHLARHRGYSVGVRAAEAFSVVRLIK
jgi:N-acetylglucosamine malate deacetylase 1